MIVFIEPKRMGNSLKILSKSSGNKNDNGEVTGLIYDEEMTEFSKRSGYHFERPDRITSIMETIKQKGLLERCKFLSSRKATEEELLSQHYKTHVNFVMGLQQLTDAELDKFEGVYGATYFHNGITKCSLISAGCTIKITEEIIKGNISNGAAIVRPPGHHALQDRPMGFCYFNNVAIAAKIAITKYNLKRILIVDWDIHYGNGTHKMFEDDPRVLYFSMHRYENQTFWPCLEEANYTSIGIGEGKGFNVHVAWNNIGFGDSEYKYAFENLLIPIAKEYDPEMIFISAGFDAGKDDPLGEFCVSPAGFGYMTKELLKFADGKVALVLEGGYNLDTISSSMSACVSVLLGDEPPPLGVLEDPSFSAKESVNNTCKTIQTYWKCLQS